MSDGLVSQRRGREAESVRLRLRALAIANEVPLHVHLELTARCNLKCVHCYLAEDHGRELTKERWLEVVDELAGEGALFVTLTGGEVALREGWLEIAARVREHRMALGILTNGTLLRPSDIDELARLKCSRMGFSVYGASAKTHDAVTGVTGSFAKTVTAIRRAREKGVECRINSVLMNETFGEYPNVKELATSLGATVVFDLTVAPRADGSHDVICHRISEEQLAEFLREDLVPDMERKDARPPSALTEDERGRLGEHRCGAGVSSAFIEADGDVFACVGFPPAFGNVRCSSFETVWRGGGAKAHRERLRRPLHTCSQCDYLGACATVRCPRLALVEDGDVSGPSSRACKIVGRLDEALRTTVGMGST